MPEQTAALLTLLVYGIILFAIGVWTLRRARSEESFLLGERNLGPVVSGLAYAASSSSAWVLLGFSGFVYVAGQSALWMVPGILAGYAAVWLWAGHALQSSSRKLGHLTLTDFLSEDASPGTARAIRVAASVMIAFCFSYYVASQFQGAGVALDGLFNTGLTMGILIGAAIILAYTFLGGFLAVSLVDTLQGLLMAVVAVVLPAVAFTAAGGVQGLQEAVPEMPATYFDAFGGRPGWLALGFVVGLTATGFGALGQPHLTAWIMAARDRKARKIGAAIAIGWAALVYLGMAILGLSARALLGGDAPAEGVFFKLAADLLPGAFAGIIAAATLSAIMSTVDSQLLVTGAAISHDLGVSRWLGGRDVLVSRLAILAVCTAAVSVTLFFPSTIFERTLFAWTALGASFGPIVAARALGHRPKGQAVLLSSLAGFGLSLVYEFLLPSGPGDVWARIIPWLASIGILMVGASLRQQTNPEIPLGPRDEA
jgi:Na+/proline symporter